MFNQWRPLSYGSDCFRAARFHAPPWLGIGRTTGRTFPPLRPDFVTKNRFPFRQVAISGRRLSQPGGGAGALVMLSTCEQSEPASWIVCASSLSRSAEGFSACAL